MSPLLAASVVCSALLVGAAYLIGMAMGTRGQRLRDWTSTKVRHRHADRAPAARPIEEVVADTRRLGRRFHSLDPHASYAKVEAVRGAYDRALAECCTALGLTHLLGVLPVGLELDVERERVEELLSDSGVRLPHAA